MDQKDEISSHTTARATQAQLKRRKVTRLEVLRLRRRARRAQTRAIVQVKATVRTSERDVVKAGS